MQGCACLRAARPQRRPPGRPRPAALAPHGALPGALQRARPVLRPPPRLLLPPRNGRGDRQGRGPRVGGPRSIVAQPGPCRPGGPVQQRFRLSGRTCARRRPRRDLSFRSQRPGHTRPAGACSPGCGGAPLRQALAQTGAHGMSLNGFAGATAHFEPALIGEVVEASTTEFLAQAVELDSAPPFGVFVQVATDDPLTVYGVVAHVQTAGIDPGSRAIMRGHGDIRDERIYEENPDLPLVLRTTFRAMVVGFAQDDTIYQFLPPRPPRLHYSVFTCAPQKVREFTVTSLDYLQALLTAAEVPVDELLAANLRYTASHS